MKKPASNIKPLCLGRFEIHLDGRNIPYILKRSQRARQLWLQIRDESGLTVTVPHHYNLDLLHAYLVSKTRWILRHLPPVENQLPLFREENAPSQPAVTYLGFPLEYLEQNNQIKYLLPDGSRVDFSSTLAWIREQAYSVIQSKAQQFCRQIGVRFSGITIRDQKTRWGSCSQTGNLNFNWRLMMAPETVIDYVVIHELCHLKRMSHSKAFWNLVTKHCPEWEEKRRWLNKHSHELRYLHSSSV